MNPARARGRAAQPAALRFRPAALLLLGALLAPLLLAGCPKPLGFLKSSGPLEIRLQQADLTLAWDHRSSSIPQSQNAIEHFRLYFRERGRRDATLVAEVRARENPTFMISADAVLGSRSSGKYELGVSSVTRRGDESSIHWSTDYEARPHGGWYVHWTRP